MKRLLLSLFTLFILNQSNAQSGTEFWFAPPDVTYLHASPGGVPIYLNMSTFSQPVTVTIDQPANPGFTPIVRNIPANGSLQEDLSLFVGDLETTPTNTVLTTGLRIVSTDTIMAYYEVSNTNNTDIFALKGKNSLGQEFYVPLHNHAPFYNESGFSAPHQAYASFDIVATENATEVMIYSPVEVDGHPALTPFSIMLDQGETYSCGWTGTNFHLPENHPSGAVIVSDKDIAVTIKDDSDHNPSGGCYDLLGDQIVPVGIVGTEYIAVKGQLNNNGDESIFILATENNTKVYINGSAVPTATLFAGQTYRYDMDYLNSSADNSVYVETSKPAYVTHVTGFGCEAGQAILPPLGCAGSEQISFTRSTSEGFFLNILVRAGSVNDFTMTGPGTATINPALFLPVPGTGGQWMAAVLPFNNTEIPVNQAYLVSNSTDVFSLAIINGGGSTGCRYGFFSEFAAEIIIDAGLDATVCANDTAQLSGLVQGGTTTGMWTTSGSGQFLPDEFDLNAQYVPSLADISAGAVTLNLISTGNCTPVSDNMTLNITPAPTADAGSDKTVCKNNPTVNLVGAVTIASGGIWSGGTGTYSPNNTSLITSYTPSAAEITAGSVTLTLTTTGNGICNQETDNIIITFSPAPTVDAGANQTVCSNNPDATLSGSITTATGGQWSGGAGTFSNVNALNATYSPTSAEIAMGSVTLTLTTIGNGNCSPESDVVTINYSPTPVVDAGADQTLCENNANVSLSGSVSIATGGQWSGGLGVFTPNSTSLNTTYTPTASEIASGSLTLVLTSTGNGLCNPESDNITISFTAAPTVDAGTDQSVCANSPNVTLNGSVSIASGGQWSGGSGTFSPNANSLNATYTPSAAEILAGTVTLTLTTTGNGNCSPVSDNVVITIEPEPITNAGANQVSCANNPNVNLAGIITNAGGGIWTGGSGLFNSSATDLNAIYTPTPSEIASGGLTLTLTSTGNGTCAATTDDVQIVISNSPTADAGVDQTVCANNADINLVGSVNGASGGQWSGGLGIFTPSNNSLNTVYTPTAGEIASGSLTLTLTTTGNGTCNPETDNVTITFTAGPTVDAGTDITSCANNPTVTLNGGFNIASGGIWSGGSGSFSPSTTDMTATYTPSTTEITNGSATLTLTTTGNGSCLSESDDIIVTIAPAPIVDAGVDQVVCANDLDVNLSGSVSGITNTGMWSTSGSGTFIPNNTTLNATYAASSADSLSGVVTLTLESTNNNTCNPVTDQMTITILPAGISDAGPDATVCANDASVSLSGTVTAGATTGTWSTNGTGVFIPNASDLNATYIPSTGDANAGNVTITLTANSCDFNQDAMAITITPAPIVNAGTDQVVCASNLSIPLIGSVTGGSTTGIWSTSGTGTFSPSNTDMNATYIASSADSLNQGVTIVLSATSIGNCLPETDTVEISIYPTGSVDAGPDQNVCANNGTIALNGSISGGASLGQWATSGSGVFSPNNTDLNATYTPSASDTATGTVIITLVATNSCNFSSDQMQLTLSPAPNVDAGADASVCSSNPNLSLNGAVVGASGAIWTTSGTGTFSPNDIDLNATYATSATDIANGSVTLYLTSTGNGSCNSVVDSLTLSISNGITVDAGFDQNVCVTSDSTQLNGVITNGSTTGIWTSLGTGTFAPNDSLLNTYYKFGSLDLTNGFVNLVLTSTNNGSCAAESDTVTINFGPSSYAFAGSDLLTCETDTVVQLNGLISGGATQGQWISLGSGTFSPSNTVLNSSYNITQNDIANGFADLVLITTDHGSCLEGRDTVRINIEDLAVVNAGSNIEICETVDSVLITGNVMNAPGGTWFTGGTGSFSYNNDILSNYYKPSLADIASGSIRLYLSSTGSSICNSITDSIDITLVSPLAVGFSNTETCIGQPMSFSDTTVINTGTITDWLWDFGDGTTSASQNPIHIFDNTGTFDVSLTATSSLGCDYEIIRTLTINTAPIAGFTINPNPAKIEENVNLTDASSGATSWAWTFGDGLGNSNVQNPAYSYTSGGDYIITQIVTSVYGCTDTTSNTITIEDNSYFPPLVPTGFSPNGDGENDQLVVLGGPFVEIELKVYNNWGNLIFESNDPTLGWDGTWKGKAQPPGDYIYTVKAITVDGEEFNNNGSVSIIK